jgi:sugar phosphate permease
VNLQRNRLVRIDNNTSIRSLRNRHRRDSIIKRRREICIVLFVRLTITIIVGNLIYVNGELIRFTTVDFVNNTLSGLQRGFNGTGARTYIPKYTEVYSVLSSNMLPELYNGFSWNSFNYNLVTGDPLQISTTFPANFLNADVP